MAQEIRLEISNLCKTIKGRQIVKNFNLTLYKGEVFGLIGPNGAGKSTTIKMLCGMSSISSGTVIYEGRLLKDSAVEIREHFGAIVENPDLYGFMSGIEQLRLFARFYPSVDEARIREVISLVKLDQAINRKSKVYSLGMKQRLALAIALLNNPDFLILDEPTNGLDPQGIREMRILLRGLAEKQGTTILVSSHILGEMEALCDRIGLIHRGELLRVGKMSEMIGDVPGNELRIRVDKPDLLADYFKRREIGFKRAQDVILLQCERDYINPLLQEVMREGLKIFGVEQVHASLEDSFMTMVEEKGGSVL